MYFASFYSIGLSGAPALEKLARWKPRIGFRNCVLLGGREFVEYNLRVGFGMPTDSFFGHFRIKFPNKP